MSLNDIDPLELQSVLEECLNDAEVSAKRSIPNEEYNRLYQLARDIKRILAQVEAPEPVTEKPKIPELRVKSIEVLYRSPEDSQVRQELLSKLNEMMWGDSIVCDYLITNADEDPVISLEDAKGKFSDAIFRELNPDGE
jgi:hypothetical protein